LQESATTGVAEGLCIFHHARSGALNRPRSRLPQMNSGGEGEVLRTQRHGTSSTSTIPRIFYSSLLIASLTPSFLATTII